MDSEPSFEINDAVHFFYAGENHVRRVIGLTEDGKAIIIHWGREFVLPYLRRPTHKVGTFQKKLFGWQLIRNDQQPPFSLFDWFWDLTRATL